MRRLFVLALVVLASCRPGDTTAWVRMYEMHPRAAMRHLRVEHPDMWARAQREAHPPPQPEPSRWVPDTACSQWAQTALDVGWTQAQWYDPISWIMQRESRCSPSAYNPSGASGLLQIMPFWQRDVECSGSLFDPATNLRCALHIYHVQGWEAWAVH